MYKSVSSSGSNSAVECNLAKVEVAGSNPVSRSRNFRPHCENNEDFFISFLLNIIYNIL